MAEPPPPPPGVGPLPQAPLTGTSPTGVGVMGNSQTGPGVLGQSFGPIPGQTGAANDGVYGVGMNGVHGVSAFATGIGVLGEGGFNGIGVSGVSSGTGAGVKGFNDSAATPQATSNAGVWGESQNANGVYGISHSSQYAGVSANNDAGGLGVEGQSTSGVGVYGQTSGSGAAIAGGPGLMVAGVSGQNLSSGYGVWGSSASGDGVFGQGGKNGVHGETASPNDCAVYGHNSAAAGGTAGCGVGGQSSNSDGVYGQGGKNGVHGESASPNDSGVWGHNSAPKGSKGYGVSGTSDQNIGVYGSITKLLPGPPPWQVSLEGDFTRGIQGGFSERFIKGGNSTDPGKYEMFLSSINVIAGAVEPFSGFSSIKDWEIKVGSAPGLPPYSDSFDPGGFQSACESTFKKIQVRVLREAMNVYSGVSLLKVWTAINSLKSLAGAAPLPRHKYARWSFREIFSAAGMGARSDGLFHLSDMAGLIWNTSPLDSQESSHSWRNLLEP